MKSTTLSPAIRIDSELTLHEAQLSDAESLFQLIDKHRQYMREWLPFVDHRMSADDVELYLRGVTAPGNMQDQVYTICYQQQIIGIIGYKTIDRINSKLEIGYWLGENFQGMGIMVRSCEALVQHAFEHMQMNRIQIKVGVGNLKSSRIPQRLGFKLEGIERDGEWLRSRFIDLEVYSLLKREWKEHLLSPSSGESA